MTVAATGNAALPLRKIDQSGPFLSRQSRPTRAPHRRGGLRAVADPSDLASRCATRRDYAWTLQLIATSAQWIEIFEGHSSRIAAEIAGGNADAGYFNCQAQELIGLTLRANFVRVPTKVSHKAIADVPPLFNAAANVALVWTRK